jgi:hypothetical protein
MKESEFGYSLDTARNQHSRGTVSPLSSASQYASDVSGGEVLGSYRQNSYPYASKGYYSGVSGWTGPYSEDPVDYTNYPSYQMVSPEPVQMVQTYGRYGSGKSNYVDPDAPGYSYGSFGQRPAAGNESPNFSLTGMAASLPSTSERLFSNVNRTLTGPSVYRSDGLTSQYPSRTTTSDVYSGLNTSFDAPITYANPETLPSHIPDRSPSQCDPYQPGTAGATDPVYSQNDQVFRAPEESNSGYNYGYGDRQGIRRESSSSGVGSTLSNGQIYVPEPHSHGQPPSQAYMVSSSAVSHAREVDRVVGATSGSGGGSSRSNLRSGSHHQSISGLRSGG